MTTVIQKLERFNNHVKFKVIVKLGYNELLTIFGPIYFTTKTFTVITMLQSQRTNTDGPIEFVITEFDCNYKMIQLYKRVAIRKVKKETWQFRSGFGRRSRNSSHCRCSRPCCCCSSGPRSNLRYLDHLKSNEKSIMKCFQFKLKQSYKLRCNF